MRFSFHLRHPIDERNDHSIRKENDPNSIERDEEIDRSIDSIREHDSNQDWYLIN